VTTAVIPDLSGFTEHFKILVSYINDEGEMVALGHHDPRHALAAFNRHARPDLGDLLAQDYRRNPTAWRKALEQVRRTWALQQFRCDEHPECGGPGECGACGDIAESRWWVAIGTNLAEVPGAFPIMYWPGQ